MSGTALPSAEIGVIGGGVIGLAIALRLARAGREVVLIEPNAPGSGASYGNAGTIADYGVMPLGNPGVLKALPRMLFDRDSPLSLRLGAVPGLAPWLARFAVNCLPAQARANAAALGALLADAGPMWREMAGEAGAEAHLRANGALYVYDTDAALKAGAEEAAFRRRYGASVEMLDAAGVARLEPGLPAMAGGQFFPGAISLDDPGAVMRKLAEAVVSSGAVIMPGKVERLERTAGGVRLTGPGVDMTVRRAVIAAGARSRPLAAQAGDRVPLDTERGYHLEFDMDQVPVNRPVCPASRGWYAVPMAGRLRIAGTVELGGLERPVNPARHDLLERGARELFPGLGAPDRKWLGFRPSVPSSVPVIRQSRGGGDVILAFGHGHLGLTMGPRTARMVERMVLAN